MKDKDFEDIGKRLHDLEADPPKDGWKRIAPAIKTPGPGGKVVWLRRNWWKPLILLLPLAYYLTVPETGISKITMSSALSRDTTHQLESEASSIAEKGATNNDREVQLSETASRQAARTAPTAADDKGNNSRSSLKKDVSNQTDLLDNRSAEQTAVQRELTTPAPQDPDTDRNNEVRFARDREGLTRDENPSSPQDDSKQVLDENVRDEIRVRTNSVVVSMDSIASADSVVAILEPADTLMTATSLETAEKKSDKTGWRITFAVTPQVVNRSVKPIVNDEVLVTSIEDRRKNFSEKLGFGFSFGAGKSLTRNIYLDAQLSYVRMGQNIFYTYATGEVDTMLAIAQPDETVRLTPVYRTLSKETSARFSHAAIRLAGTYYFWTKGRRRYNATVALSTNYLVASEVKERTGYVWTEYNDAALNKLNYTFSVGGGYNIFLGKDWELMISPVVLYNLRQIRTNALPYHLKQQSAGLNIMLSKYLRTKQ